MFLAIALESGIRIRWQVATSYLELSVAGDNTSHSPNTAEADKRCP